MPETKDDPFIFLTGWTHEQAWETYANLEMIDGHREAALYGYCVGQPWRQIARRMEVTVNNGCASLDAHPAAAKIKEAHKLLMEARDLLDPVPPEIQQQEIEAKIKSFAERHPELL